MCLFTEQRKMQTATEDIICYKVLIYYKPTNKFFTPRQRFEWNVAEKQNITNDEKVDISKINSESNYWNNELYGKYLVCGGVFHTFKELNPVIRTISISSYNDKYVLAYATCIIPKGTKYYYGLTYGFSPFQLEESYASKKLKIVKYHFL